MPAPGYGASPLRWVDSRGIRSRKQHGCREDVHGILFHVSAHGVLTHCRSPGFITVEIGFAGAHGVLTHCRSPTRLITGDRGLVGAHGVLTHCRSPGVITVEIGFVGAHGVLTHCRSPGRFMPLNPTDQPRVRGGVIIYNPTHWPSATQSCRRRKFRRRR
jgi:hypothetical protein